MNQIRDYRNRLGLTQKQLSEKTGISLASISSYERELRRPKIDKLIKISKILKTKPTYLTGMKVFNDEA
ncbi:helix-turn-helix transcriptional regulator [Fructobacillus cardui]|uniref:helix-turn-helix domain-containing protein n=1 Tax=Fructobacillus cardui TaxID=2893170 RepID=UPI002DB1C697|nr:Transcriptional regulator [Fructobacillus cardui]